MFNVIRKAPANRMVDKPDSPDYDFDHFWRGSGLERLSHRPRGFPPVGFPAGIAAFRAGAAVAPATTAMTSDDRAIGGRGNSPVKKSEIEVSFGSQLEFLDLIQNFSEAVIGLVGFDEDTRYWISMSVRESVTNAIQHGNRMDAAKKVGVRFEIDSQGLAICVRDQGEGFDASGLPDPLDPDNLLKPSGRGIFYVRSFMDEVSFRQLPGGGMEIRMVKRLNQPNKRKRETRGDKTS